MANITLGKQAFAEIRLSMRGLRGSVAKQTAVRLAELHKVSWQHIYKITDDLRPKNKTRSDKGKRTFQLIEGTDLWIAAQLVISDKLDPDQALRVCELRGLTDLPSLEYFQRILRENGLGAKQRKSSKRPFRLWEAAAPGEIYQIDVTALKVRWEDEKTRRILRIEGVDKNHPNLDDDKIRVWQIMAVDDHSRRRFLRYVATTHITSRDMVEFCIELFTFWGVPKVIYSDNGAEFKGYFIRAEKILKAILEADGGFEHKRHLPGNSQASGKVENAHKWAEKMDKYVGLAVSEGQGVTIDDLNPFADDVCKYYNARVQRSTMQTPDARWFSTRIVVRTLPSEIIESALLADEFETTLDASLTFAHKGIVYKVPGKQPFVNFIGSKINVVVPINIDLILLTLPDKSEHEIEKVIATADVAGDYKSHAESVAQDIKKRLKATRKAAIKEIKLKQKQTGEIAPVPHYNVRIETPATNVAHFPHQERIITPEEVAAVAVVPPSVYKGKQISYWEAVGIFADSFETPADCRAFLLTVFGDYEKKLVTKDVAEIVESRELRPSKPQLRAVR